MVKRLGGKWETFNLFFLTENTQAQQMSIIIKNTISQWTFSIIKFIGPVFVGFLNLSSRYYRQEMESGFMVFIALLYHGFKTGLYYISYYIYLYLNICAMCGNICNIYPVFVTIVSLLLFAGKDRMCVNNYTILGWGGAPLPRTRCIAMVEWPWMRPK